MVYIIELHTISAGDGNLNLDYIIRDYPEGSKSVQFLYRGLPETHTGSINFMGSEYEGTLSMSLGNLRYSIPEGSNILKKITDVENTTDLYNGRVERDRLFGCLESIVTKNTINLLENIDRDKKSYQTKL